MAQPARKHDPTNVQLTIVPWDSFEEPTPAPAPEMKAAPKPQPKPAAPPRKGRTGLLVAGALGGGMMMGGGAVGLLSLLIAAVAVAGAGIVALFFWLSAAGDAVEEVAEVEPIVVEAPEVVEEVEEAATPAKPRVEPEAVAAAPEPTPAPATSSAPPPAPSAPAAAPAEPAVLPDTVVVKVLTDPPAALLWVDGADMGRSPAKLTLEPGSYQLTIESGKASGTFPIDAGLDSDRYCFEARGKKLSMVGCN